MSASMLHKATSAFLLFLLTCSSLQAGILTGDWKVGGDKKLTIDTSQGLEFLDLTESTGRSFVDVNSQFGLGGDFEGFRYATSQEVVDLINNFGWNPTLAVGALGTASFHSDPTSTLAATIVDHVGQTAFGRSGQLEFYTSIGFTGTPDSPNFQQRIEVVNRVNTTGSPSADSINFGRVFNTTSSSTVGSWLVRNAANTTVPEPTSLIVIGCLFAPVALVRRRTN